MITRCLISLCLAVLLAPAPEAGQRTVLFVDGRTLQVAGVSRNGGVAQLALDGGGQLAVPAARIANWLELERPRPAPKTVQEFAKPGEAWRLAAGEYADLLAIAADRYALDPALLVALAQVESSLDPLARSPKGASGLLQLMPATAERFGVEDVFDVSQNVDGGARYLSWLLDRYDGQTHLALAGYNAGEQAVDRHQGIPPFSETRNYVSRVLEQADLLAGGAQ